MITQQPIAFDPIAYVTLNRPRTKSNDSKTIIVQTLVLGKSGKMKAQLLIIINHHEISHDYSRPIYRATCLFT